ncbi:LysR substrate-binding domain-containing protein [Rhodobacter sp. KR11]|uniref:LysR substrate-binding domain-containing protein n=1 Tax=Rhodobacter sp. KR11 TaxID=2974588 RepID=UPI002223B0ED|nr:LysR substrate-binding domain-containing protein [Rhodobacter sp. KR11]MCW1920300.1 LysR substrate-binding domain-containing protein [Rhodobacter sp. KR11]
MTSLRRNLSSLNLLSTFESAARLGSFTLAAAELRVTQAAVSQQIKTLEREMNTALFLRAHRRVTLTAAGQALAGVVGAAFQAMSEVIETIRRPESPDMVAVGVTLAFNQFWLMPRLPDFRARHPKIKLRLVADDTAMDLRPARLDIAIRYGKPPFEDAISHASRGEEAFPVCAPALLTRLGLAPDTSLDQLPLIACDMVNPAWMPWRSWARALSLGPGLERRAEESPLRFNHYSDTVQAALNGEGVTMGWGVLLSEHLAAGRLVRVGRDLVTPEARYHLVTPRGQVLSPATQAVLDWLVQGLAGGEKPLGLEVEEVLGGQRRRPA